MAQWVKELVLSLLWLRLLLQLEFNLWTRNFHVLQAWLREKKKKKKRRLCPGRLGVVDTRAPRQFSEAALLSG